MQQLNKLADIKAYTSVTTGEEYTSVLHSLRLNTGFTNIVIKDIRKLQEKYSEFEKVSANKLIIESWIRYDDIATNYKEITFLKGAPFTNGIVFKTPSEVEYDTEYKLVLCSIIIGRSLTIKSDAPLPSSKADLPVGYDSVYKMKPGRKEEKDGEEGQLYRHEYYIYEPSYVYPLYYVMFTISQEQNQKDKGPLFVRIARMYRQKNTV